MPAAGLNPQHIHNAAEMSGMSSSQPEADEGCTHTVSQRPFALRGQLTQSVSAPLALFSHQS